MQRSFIWIISALIAVLAIATLVDVEKPAVSSAVKSTGEALIGGPFTHTNQRGEQVKDSDFRGKLMLVFFGFTYCPEICPTDLTIISNVMEEMDENGEIIAPIFISIDPKRDTVEQLAGYFTSFHPTITALTGTTEQIDEVKKHYRVYARKVQDESMSEYTMDHSAYMYLMDESGRFITHFQHGESPEKIINTIKTYLEESRA